MEITKTPNGTWKCLSTGGRPCNGAEGAAWTTVTKSRSNTKDNFTVDPDGTLKCIDVATGKPCSDEEVQAVVHGVANVKVILGKPGGSETRSMADAGQATAPQTQQQLAAVLKDVSITKTPNGTWKCLSTGGRPCTGPEVAAVSNVTKSRSNTKNNFTVAPDGTMKCMDAATNKPCSDEEWQAVAKGIVGVKVILGKQESKL